MNRSRCRSGRIVSVSLHLLLILGFTSAIPARFGTGLTTAASRFGGLPSAFAEPWRAGIRLHASGGTDTNVLEVLDDRVRTADGFVRLMGEGRLGRSGLPLGSRGQITVRALGDRYLEESSEARLHGEALLGLDLGGPGRHGRSRFEAGYGRRAYPDSTARNHRREWGRLTSGFRLGPDGTLITRVDYWGLDFRRTPRKDQTGLGVDLTYEHPVGGWGTLAGGLELGDIRHGLAAIRILRGAPEMPPVIDQDSPDRRDNYRFVHAGLRVLRRGLVRVQYGYRHQQSNSIDAGFGRHEFRWLVSRSLPANLMGQFYGNLEHTRYSEPRLSEVLILRSGEVEAGEDDNTVALRLSRMLSSRWTAEIRHAWYRNESLLLQNYYRKRVWSIGLGWEAGVPSAF